MPDTRPPAAQALILDDPILSDNGFVPPRSAGAAEPAVDPAPATATPPMRRRPPAGPAIARPDGPIYRRRARRVPVAPDPAARKAPSLDGPAAPRAGKAAAAGERTTANWLAERLPSGSKLVLVIAGLAFALGLVTPAALHGLLAPHPDTVGALAAVVPRAPAGPLGSGARYGGGAVARAALPHAAAVAPVPTTVAANPVPPPEAAVRPVSPAPTVAAGRGPARTPASASPVRPPTLTSTISSRIALAMTPLEVAGDRDYESAARVGDDGCAIHSGDKNARTHFLSCLQTALGQSKVPDSEPQPPSEDERHRRRLSALIHHNG